MEYRPANIRNQMGILKIIQHSWLLPKLLWLTLIWLSLFVHLTKSLITCGSNKEITRGMFPSGDIVLEYGSDVPLEITCVLDPKNEIVQNMLQYYYNGSWSTQPSQKIIFYKNYERVSEQYVSIINSTAAKLRLINSSVGKFTYHCTLLLHNQYREDKNYKIATTINEPIEKNGVFQQTRQGSNIGVCLINVSVGYKPFHITNFTCTSYNWDNLTCNWTKPFNPVETTYKIFFRLPGRASNRFVASCPTDSDVTDNFCYWDISTSPIYRKPHEYYYFTLYGENALGNSSTSIRFHHYANVIPASPYNIIAMNTTRSSVMLRWSIGSMENFPQDLVHKIEYNTRRDSNTKNRTSVQFVNPPECNSLSTINQITSFSQNLGRCQITFNVTDLKFPFTEYDFYVYVRTSSAQGEDKWSAPGSITVKTKSTIPKTPPKIDVGGFEIVPSNVDQHKRDVFIYWQDIDDSEKCGDSFQYLAFFTSTTADNQITVHCSSKTYDDYAVFEELSTEVGYNFYVYSSNSEGLSTDFSSVYMPSESQIQKPQAVTLTTDVYGSYELSWKNTHDLSFPITDQPIINYTLFWCVESEDSSSQCEGHMNWTHVPSSQSRYNFTGLNGDKNLRFAISANSVMKNAHGQFTLMSSGMVRESCRVLYGRTDENNVNVTVSVDGSRFIVLKWNINGTEKIDFVDSHYVKNLFNKLIG